MLNLLRLYCVKLIIYNKKKQIFIITSSDEKNGQSIFIWKTKNPKENLVWYRHSNINAKNKRKEVVFSIYLKKYIKKSY